MRKAVVSFDILMRYETEIEEYDEEYSLEEEIKLTKEYLETQGEDLLDALMDAEKISVEIVKIREIKDKFVNNFQI